MTHWTEAADLLEERDVKSAFARHAPGAVAFVLCAALGVYIAYFRFAQQPSAAPCIPCGSAEKCSD